MSELTSLADVPCGRPARDVDETLDAKAPRPVPPAAGVSPSPAQEHRQDRPGCHSKARDAEAIHAPLRRLERASTSYVLGDVDGLHVRVPTRARLVHPRGSAVRTSTTWCPTSSRCKPGMRLLDVGCGWGQHGRCHAAEHYGVQAVLGVTLSSRDQALNGRPEGGRAPRASPTSSRSVSTATTATSPRTGFDAVASIGLTEHIGLKAQLKTYFSFLYAKLNARAAGMLNHCITRPDAPPTAPRARTRSSTATSSRTESSKPPAPSCR